MNTTPTTSPATTLSADVASVLWTEGGFPLNIAAAPGGAWTWEVLHASGMLRIDLSRVTPLVNEWVGDLIVEALAPTFAAFRNGTVVTVFTRVEA